jgi:tetratricopeptide (TPR) repeat protein
MPPEGRDPLLVRWETEVAAIDAARQQARDDDSRLLVQRRIVALHTELDALRRAADTQLDALRAVALAWKRDISGAPVATTRRIDHLGASTFIEKGWARLAQGDAEGAVVSLTRALDLTPDDRQVQAMHAWALLLAGRGEQALHILHGVLVRDSRHGLARAVTGLAAQRAGRLDDATEHLLMAVRSGDAKAVLYATYWLGQVYLDREMPDDAIPHLEHALELGPNLLEAAFALGRAHWARGAHDMAITTWQRAAASNRFSPWAARCADAADRALRGESPVTATAQPV